MANRRLDFLCRVNERLAGAENEDALIEAGLDLVGEAVPAIGCSVLRFDERGLPLPAVHRGGMDPAWFEAWTDHLMGTGQHLPCPDCAAPRASGMVSCPRSIPPTALTAAGRAYCLAVGRRQPGHGVLNVYTQEDFVLDRQDRLILQAIADGLALALEGQSLRNRETLRLHHVRHARLHSTLQAELALILTRSVTALDAAGGALFVIDPETMALDRLAQAGDQSPLGLAQSLIQDSQRLVAPLLIGELGQTGSDAGQGMSLLLVPLCGGEGTIGSLALWAAAAPGFDSRSGQVAAILADQVALLVESHRLGLHAEHQVILAERARLAREIHDGLAQTLGYLHLRAAQIGRWLDRGDGARGRAALQEMEGVLATAYADVRETIDGLHLQPGGGSASVWLDQVLADFQRSSGVSVETTLPAGLFLPPEIEVHLVRIVQEALNNVRKHAAASRAWLRGSIDGQVLTLHITDDGRGFGPGAPSPSHYGLRMMRERAELLNAELQIVSDPGTGTTVTIRLPLPHLGPEEANG